MPRAYVAAKMEHDLRLRGLRDEIYGSVVGSHYYDKKDPHITVIPPFNVAEGNEREVESLVDSSELVGKDVTVDGLAVWKNIHQPYVVMFDVTVDIEDERQRLLQELEPLRAGPIPEPVSPHITLFKTGQWYEGHTTKTKRSIQREILERNSFIDTKIQKVEAEFKHN